MIKDNNNYLYLIVPNEYRCVYYNILDTLGTLGEDLLSSCTATCKGRAISGFACYNMFIAACAAYYLGQVKKARVLISYIKAQLEINCNKILIFEDSLNDEWIYLTVPKAYQCVFEKLLNKLAAWGQELLDDCTVSCKGQNKNILNAWNLFNAACIAYDTCGICKADYIVNYIKGLLGFNCPDEEPGFKEPSLTNFVLTYNYDENVPSINIINGTVNIENINSIEPNSLKLINYTTGNILAEGLAVSEQIQFNINNLGVEYSSNIDFILEVKGTNGLTYYSNTYRINIPEEPYHPGPDPEPYDEPVINLLDVDYEISPIIGPGLNSDRVNLVIKGFTATCENIQNIDSNGLKFGFLNSTVILNNITPAANIVRTNLNNISVRFKQQMVIVELSCVGTNGVTYSSTKSINIQIEKIVYSGYVQDYDIPSELTEEELLAYGLTKQVLSENDVEFDTSDGQGTKLLIVIPNNNGILSAENNNFEGDFIEDLLVPFDEDTQVGDKFFTCYKYEVPVEIDNTYHITLEY